MNFPRFLSFAVPGGIVFFAILGSWLTSAAQRYAHDQLRSGTFWWIRFGVGLGAALLALSVAVYGLANLI